MVSKAAVRRLRLKPGDIVVVRSSEDLEAVWSARTDFPVPIVVAEGSIHRLSKEYLRKLLAE